MTTLSTRAPTAGVREAPRHEIAGGGAVGAAGYGGLAAEGIVGMVDSGAAVGGDRPP